MLGKDDAPSTYTLRLHFANLDAEGQPAAARTFAVRANGKTIVETVTLESSAAAIVHEVPGVPVTDNLVLELVPASRTLPVLNALEVRRERE